MSALELVVVIMIVAAFSIFAGILAWAASADANLRLSVKNRTGQHYGPSAWEIRVEQIRLPGRDHFVRA